MPWTYMLECSDGSYYVGSTKDLDGRLSQHASGRGGAYTRKRLPVALVWAEEFERVDDAWAMEHKVQGWTRVKKLALIEGRIGELQGYSARSRGKALFQPEAAEGQPE
ncbi:GIY-YIG nuclease family protein [Mariniluteicoccus flavus]